MKREEEWEKENTRNEIGQILLCVYTNILQRILLLCMIIMHQLKIKENVWSENLFPKTEQNAFHKFHISNPYLKALRFH